MGAFFTSISSANTFALTGAGNTTRMTGLTKAYAFVLNISLR
jgi:hypothetical protein